MKKHLFKVCLLGLLAINGAYADDVCTVIGYHEPNTNNYDGPTVCKQGNLDSITVRGPLHTMGTTIANTTDVSGSLNANASQFSQIVSENNGSYTRVTLKNGSVVNQDVVFKGAKAGQVYIDGSSRINGNVVNGKIHHLS